MDIGNARTQHVAMYSVLFFIDPLSYSTYMSNCIIGILEVWAEKKYYPKTSLRFFFQQFGGIG